VTEPEYLTNALLDEREAERRELETSAPDLAPGVENRGGSFPVAPAGALGGSFSTEAAPANLPSQLTGRPAGDAESGLGAARSACGTGRGFTLFPSPGAQTKDAA
jgi:hypothetical protein